VEGIAAGGALDEITATDGQVGFDGGPEASGERALGRGRDDLGGRGREGGSSELPSLGKADPAGRGGRGAYGGEMPAGGRIERLGFGDRRFGVLRMGLEGAGRRGFLGLGPGGL